MAYGPELNTLANAISLTNEVDAITGWTEYGLNGTGDNVFESQSDTVHDGTYAFLINANPTGASGARIYLAMKTTFGINIGDTVRLTCWVRHIGEGADWIVRLARHHDLLVYSELNLTLTSNDTTWQQISVTYVHTEDTVYFGTREWGSNDGGIYMDGLSIKKYLGDFTLIENGMDGDDARDAINDNFTSLFASGVADIPIWQLSNIFMGLQRIPAFFERIDPDNPSSPGGQLNRFVIASSPDTHSHLEPLSRLNTFLKLVSPEGNISATVIQGDIITEQDTKAEAIAAFKVFTDLIPDYHTDLLGGIGNHDINGRYSNAVDMVMSKADFRSALIDPMIDAIDGIVSDVLNLTANYYYKDYDTDDYKVRVIMLDQYDNPEVNDGTDYTYTMYYPRNYSQAQLTWLAEVALAVPTVDWHVIIFGHQRLNASTEHNTSGEAMLQIIDAFTQQGTVDMDDATADFEYDIDIDFSSINGFNGTVIGYFFGHGHTLVMDTVEINGRDYNNTQLPAADTQRINYNNSQSLGTSDMATFIVVDVIDKQYFLLRYGNPSDVDGYGLPFGDFGIDTPITY